MAALITEVSVTESGVATLYSDKVPTGLNAGQFLHKLATELVKPREGNGRLDVPGSSPPEQINRQNVTSVAVTLAW